MMLNAPVARILVIDDEPVVVDMLVTWLREEGYGAVGAGTSDEGLKLAILSRPELVLLDIALPGMNGIELLKRIRSINPTTRVIMVTGNTDPGLAREALELGALA
jgi:DNA-binding response OmpR family regulator